MSAHITVLVAEDFQPFRDFVCREVRRGERFNVVAVSDGLDAVQKAEELRPELILLDIGLPRLNGLDAARAIRLCSPHSKIVFLTQESSVDVIDEAFAVGARGYIDKLGINGYLLAAVEGVLDGPSPIDRAAQPDADGAPRTNRHHVHFYSGDSILLDRLERFVASALIAHDAAIVLATRTHLEVLRQRLRSGGIDVDRAATQGTLLLFDAIDMLSTVMCDGSADYERFRVGLGQLIESAAHATMKPAPHVAVFGECVALLCASAHFDAALGLEATGNELLAAPRTATVDIMCAYPLHASNTDHTFTRICAQHSTVAVR